MRTKRRDLKDQLQGRGSESVNPRKITTSLSSSDSDYVYYELFNMIAGTGMGLAGGGAGMLRARRRDISIKPNRKLDRKSSRGMIYENEELRLRTIHINAEVEQGQNDIKKLRRENEQLRREIWSLRDEYDKLEEILKKQKSREESDEPEDRSDTEAAGSEYSEDDEDEEDEEIDEEESSSAEEEQDQEGRHENDESQKLSSEKLNNNNHVTSSSQSHRTRINFDGLPVVTEEEELKKEKDKKDTEQLPPATTQQNPEFVSYQQTAGTSSYTYQNECPFVFPSTSDQSNIVNYSNITTPLNGSNCLSTTCPQMCMTQQLNSNFDFNNHNHTLSTPPPAGWQNSVNPITASNFSSMPARQTLTPSKDITPQDIKEVKNCQPTNSLISKLTKVSSLAEKRKAFFRQHGDTFNTGGSQDTSRNVHSFDTVNKTSENTRETELKNRLRSLSIDEKETNGESTIDNKPKHFFAPLKSRSPFNDVVFRSIDTSSTSHSDSNNSPGSENTISTVISRDRYNGEKGSADICVNGAIPCNGVSHIEKGDAKAFFSSENLLVVNDVRINNESNSNSSNNYLTKSVSCQDLSSRISFTENNLKSLSNDNHAKSDNTLDNISVCSRGYRSQLNVTLRQPGQSRKSPSPDTPEIPKLPSIDYKLFNNPFLQNFEQAYQNFPVRTEGQSPVTHPLSIQVCESPVSATSYSSPVRVQPSFSGPPEPADCGTCKRKDLERLRLMIPSSKLLDSERQDTYNVTSFETPSPHTIQIPPMTPYELEALRRMPTITSPVPQATSRLYQNVPFVPRSADAYCPGQGVRMYYDTVKVPAQTQTSLEDEVTTTTQADSDAKTTNDNNQSTPDSQKKRRSRKEKSESMKEKRRTSQKLKKQNSVSSKDVPESPSKVKNRCQSETLEDKNNESRSSSSGQESSPRKETKRVSLYLSTKKRPSISSIRTSRSRSIDNTRERHFTRGDTLDGNNSERERTNSINSRDGVARTKSRKSSTSSGSVPWCACWGNGCL